MSKERSFESAHPWLQLLTPWPTLMVLLFIFIFNKKGTLFLTTYTWTWKAFFKTFRLKGAVPQLQHSLPWELLEILNLRPPHPRLTSWIRICIWRVKRCPRWFARRLKFPSIPLKHSSIILSMKTTPVDLSLQ